MYCNVALYLLSTSLTVIGICADAKLGIVKPPGWWFPDRIIPDSEPSRFNLFLAKSLRVKPGDHVAYYQLRSKYDGGCRESSLVYLSSLPRMGHISHSFRFVILHARVEHAARLSALSAFGA